MLRSLRILDMRRVRSPFGADSTLITSAPISANMRVTVGPASARVKCSDAAIALGVDYDLPPALAADGISEWLDVIGTAHRVGPDPGRRDLPLGALVPVGQVAPGRLQHLHAA